MEGGPRSELFYDLTHYQIGRAKSRSAGQLLELPFIHLIPRRRRRDRLLDLHAFNAVVIVVLPNVWIGPGAMIVFSFSSLIYIEKHARLRGEASDP